VPANDLIPLKGKESLTPAEFNALSDIPPELEWLANITNAKTRRAYKVDVAEFMAFGGLPNQSALRTVTRAHVIAWRKDMEKRKLAPSSVRRKLSALSSLFDYLCERNAVLGNPVDGVKRPAALSNEGSTPALGDAQARRLLDAPPANTLKGARDRAILATLLYHGMRREELCLLRLRDIQSREGVPHFRIQGKRGKIRFVPVHPMALRLIGEYLQARKHGGGRCTKAWILPYFSRSATTALASWKRHLIRGRSTETSSASTAATPAFMRKSTGCACTLYGRPPLRTPCRTRLTLPRCRNGLGMRTCPPLAFTTGARHGRRTARRAM
jgi:integrase/recombinase XerD